MRQEKTSPPGYSSPAAESRLPPKPKSNCKMETSNKSQVGAAAKDLEITKFPATLNEVDDSCYGPALPPGYCEPLRAIPPDPKKKKMIGPTLPRGKTIHCTEIESSMEANQADIEGPIDDETDIGPAVALATPHNAEYDAVKEFTERMASVEAHQKLSKMAKADNGGRREEWMTQLPEIGLSKDVGLTARTFRSKDVATQDQSWTHSSSGGNPSSSNADRKRPHSDVVAPTPNKDKEIETYLHKYNKTHRKESLVNMHQKKKQESKEKDDAHVGKQPRQEFSRERDLHVNQFGESQRSQIIKKSAQLDSRFSHGSKKYE